MARIVHRLVGEPAREGAVSHHGDYFELLADQIARRGDAVCGREAGPRVPGPELVVRTLAAPQEPGQAARLAQRRQAIVATGEDLPGVALMAHIPHDLVAGRSEEHTSELQSLAYLVCRLLLEKKKNKKTEEHSALSQGQN